MRGKLGESLSSVQKYATPLEEATTPSLEALKAYSLGAKTRYAKGATAALPFYKRAVELDPNFAMAYAAMSVASMTTSTKWAGGGECTQGLRPAGEGERAGAVLHRGNTITYVTGELEKAAQTYELWQQTYPRDDMPYRMLGLVSQSLGNWEKALEEYREAMRLEPNDVDNYANLGFTYMTLNRLDEAEAVYKQAEERKLENESAPEPLLVGFSEGRYGADGAVGLSSHGKAGHGRPVAGLASGYGRLVRQAEERARTDPAGDGFRPAQ